MSAAKRFGVGALGAGVYLGLHALLGGLRLDNLWLALAGLALWLAPGRLRPLARFCVPLLVIGVVYDAQRYWAEALRGVVHVAEPHAWELAWFGLPGAHGPVTLAHWWQSHTHPVLDAVAGVAYLGFIPVFLGLAAWWRFRLGRVEALEAMWAMMVLNLAAYTTFLLYPAAPPWYVDHYGFGPVNLAAAPEAAGAARFDALFGVTWFADFYGRNTNIFGAIPSLHVGQSFLGAWYAWRFRALRGPATAYWLVVTWASAYLNHHYIVDGVAGVAYAVLVALGFAVGGAWWRRRARAAEKNGV
ncbi:phosphatase PAP2 family protein [Opitutus sp. ER46]|uniref:phosphatase PAP2 family protein n=1 Tax=Opitutus sp. ER46 TaxID=2161864 RepID=UPI0013049511|nr:phosphatase PAP2 family protein [Opitutus sp. ER46]